MANNFLATMRRSTRAVTGFVERLFPAYNELVPALDGVGGHHAQEEEQQQQQGEADTSILKFAAPKQKVSHMRRRLRQTHKWMKPDKSVYQCPTCKAFKKRHIAMHCARAEDICGLGHDTYVFNMPYDEKPKGMRSTTHQYHSSMRGVSWQDSEDLEETK